MTEDTTDAGKDEDTTVLVVDDERDLADLYETWLSDDFNVRTAYDGESALDQIDESVDVVLLDRRMPTLSGDDVLETIRDRSCDCRVAMVTAVEPDVDIVSMGFDDYLQKPVDREQLIDTVRRLSRRSQYDSQMRQYFAAARKRSILDERMSPAERSNSEEYQDLESELERLHASVDDIASDMENEDFETLFKQIE
ncbi:MAG: response regulator [Halanaeroarchaeum sp.]